MSSTLNAGPPVMALAAPIMTDENERGLGLRTGCADLSDAVLDRRAAA